MNRRIVWVLAGCLFGIGLLLSSSNSGFAEEAKKILCIEAYDMLNTVPDTYLIDVRTREEYQLVGHPINAYLFPFMFMSSELKKNDDRYEYLINIKNKDFIKEISQVFKKTDNLLIISRNGLRSDLAAKELLSAGFKKVYDVENGFEGPEFPSFSDSNKQKFYRQLAKRNKIYGFNHRRHYGWQWWGLPWTYEIDPKFIYPPDLNPPKKK
jgi:rhodanese-related sulfurtransferase